MRKANWRTILAVLLAGVMGLSTVACGSTPSSSSEGGGTGSNDGKSASTSEEGKLPEPIELKIATFRVGTHNAAGAETSYFEEFQEKYNGVDQQKITLKIEEMPSDQEYYNQMKIRASSNTLPDVFEGNGGTLELAVENGIAVDMNPYIEADAEYAKELGEGALEYGRQWKGGGLYNISYGLQAIGYFYNKDLFTQAGIQVPKTWDEWMSNLEKLKTSGVCTAPISLMTGENGWTTNLVLASIIGTSGEDGNKWMNTKYVDTYQKPAVIDAFAKIQTMLQQYALPDAVGSDYATAANHFLNGETAIIANGPWMTPDFSDPEKAPEGFADKVGVALFPENGSVSQYERGYSIAKSDKAHEDAAMEFIKFKTNAYGQSIHLEEAGVLPMNPKMEIPASFKEKNPLVVEFVGLLDNLEYQYQTIDTISYTTVMDSLTTLYPQLADGTLSPEDMCKKLDEAAEKDANYGKE